MCGHCGCGEPDHEHEHEHADGTRHSHSHTHRPHARANHAGRAADPRAGEERWIAARNRAWFAGREMLAVNLVSSPGAGKTTLLERTIRDLRKEYPIACSKAIRRLARPRSHRGCRRPGDPGEHRHRLSSGSGQVARGLNELAPGPAPSC